MSEQSAEEVILRRYLLADLNEKQRGDIEERLLFEDDLAEELSAAEDGLVDDYVFDALTPHEREQFEQNFILSDARRKNLLLAHAMDVYLERKAEHSSEIEKNTTPVSTWKKFFLWSGNSKVWVTVAAAAVITLIVGAAAVFKWLRPNASSPGQRAFIERQVAEFNRRPFSSQTLKLPTLELSLHPTLLRGGGGDVKQVEINQDLKLLNLRLALPGVKYGKYDALVRTAEGNELFAVPDLIEEVTDGGPSVLLRIPSELFPTNDYQVDLHGISTDGSRTSVALYNLRVINTANPQ